MWDNKYNTLKSIFEIENVETRLGNLYDYATILNMFAKEKYSIAEELDISDYKAKQLVRILWPNKPSTNTKVCTYVLSLYELKFCSNCKLVKDFDSFSLNKARSSGLNSVCKSCYTETTRNYQREYQKRRKALKLSRVPKWANIDKIKEIYINCPNGYHVDHIVPLQGANVCGFHVEYNLQYLTAEENLQKGNKFAE